MCTISFAKQRKPTPAQHWVDHQRGRGHWEGSCLWNGRHSPQYKTYMYDVPSDEYVCRTQEKGWVHLPGWEHKSPSQVRALPSPYICFILCPSVLAGDKIAVWESVITWVGERAEANHCLFLKGRQLPTTCLRPERRRRHGISEWRRLRHWLISWTGLFQSLNWDCV